MDQPWTSPAGVRPARGTLLGVPDAADAPGADVIALGVPYDIATDPHRVGSRQGPDHVRVMSAQTRPALVDVENGAVLDRLRIADAGDVDVTPGRPDDAYPRIEAAVAAILAAGATPLTIGGDGAVTLPQLRAVAARRGPLAVVHLDAHTDAYPGGPAEPYTNATTFARAVEEGVVDPAASTHLGVRGTTTFPGAVAYARDLGYAVATMPEVREAGPRASVRAVLDRLGDRPVYLCWDMDVFDPSVAPGVCTPEWGGFTAAEGIEFARALAGTPIAAVDANTVSPPHDPYGQTGSLAARMILEFLHLIAGGRA
jgi:agmatinase